jgi:hypothetical protein
MPLSSHREKENETDGMEGQLSRQVSSLPCANGKVSPYIGTRWPVFLVMNL